jgi:hypothetical protein
MGAPNGFFRRFGEGGIEDRLFTLANRTPRDQGEKIGKLFAKCAEEPFYAPPDTRRSPRVLARPLTPRR